jgi:plastocyanin
MKKLLVAFALIFASIALVACGGSDSSDTTASETTSESGAAAGGGNASEAEGKSAGSAAVLDFEADPGGGLAYTSDSASAQAGEVTVDFTNPQPLTHDVAIEDSGGKTIGKTALIEEGSDSAVVSLETGEYTFYCTVPGHREAGMEGALTVK